MSLYINTEAVENAASQIANINQRISDEFPNIETAIKNLDKKWDGSAAYIAMESFKNLKNAYCEQRYDVINDLVNFMLLRTSELYEYTESIKVCAASAFKK